MRIGIDLDGVVFNTEMVWAVYAELYDHLDLKRDSVINREEPRIQEKYDWSREEKEKYLDRYVYLEEFDLVPGAKEVLELLKKDGHELIVITARGHLVSGEIGVKIAKRKIKEAGIEIDEYHWGQKNKEETCKNENIDIMIDDNYHICEAVNKEGINVLYFHSLGRKNLKESDTLKQVYNWGEIYKYISELHTKKVKDNC